MQYSFLTLIFTITCKLVHTVTFSCVSSECIIENVTSKDINIVLQGQNNYNYNYNYGPRQTVTITKLTILKSTMDEILPISPSTNGGSINLNYLSCIQCGLSDITKYSFTQSNSFVSDLVTLDMSVGSYNKLQKKLFSSLPALARLNVSHGVISEIDDAAFFNLGKLNYLDLSHNNISKVTPDVFMPIENLLNLDISFNHINILDVGMFASNTKLSILSLAHNEISSIDGRLFCLQCVLNSINLSHNALSELDTVNCNADELYVDFNRLKQISITSKVQVLNADHNIVENVTCDTEGNQLKKLSLENNSLAELGCITSLTQLTELYLSYNNFGKLDQSSFAALTGLTQLRLKSANISQLEYGVFSHQNELQILDISYNQMGNIAMDILLAASNLQYLYIDGNNITEFSYIDLRKAFSVVSAIGIGDNDFNCTFLGQVIKQLNSDNISTTVSSERIVTNSHNINGIGCRDSKEPTTSSWINSVTANDNTTSAIIRQVEKLSEDVRAVKQQNLKINNDILTIKGEILKIELTKGQNDSSTSSDAIWTQINQLNNITLEKQQIGNRAQMQEINELKFEIEKDRRKISDRASDIEKLVKELTILQSRSAETSKYNSHPDLDVIKNVNIVLITLIVAFCVYKGYKFIKNDGAGFRRYNTTNTLPTNIEMDNNFNK